MIFFSNDDVSFHWHNKAMIISWIRQVAAKENATINSLSYVFCSDTKILEINKEYLNHQTYTDVITFNLSDSTEIEGEVYISIDRVLANSKEYSVTFEKELCRVIVHGLLHLVGYNDKNEQQRQEMHNRESLCLSLLPDVPRGTFID